MLVSCKLLFYFLITLLTVNYYAAFVVNCFVNSVELYQCVLNSDVSALSTCPILECLWLEHNPVVEDPLYRSVIIHSLVVSHSF